MEALACLAMQHVNHDDKWLFEAASFPNRGRVCIACLLERLRLANQLTVTKKVVINELRALFSARCKQLGHLLTENIPVAIYAVQILLDLTLASDDSLVTVSVECALQIIRVIKNEDGVIDVFESVVAWMNCKGLPFQRWALYLIGQLLVWHPQCTGHISTNGPLLDIINSALRFPDDYVKSVAIFVVVHLVRSVGWTCCLLDKPLPHEVVNILDTAQSKELRTNAMALVRLMVLDDGLRKMLFAVNRDGRTFPLVLKKIVQLNDCDLQVACVQCIDQILLVGEPKEEYAQILLQNDIAEFLFEALCDMDELLVESILNCCLTFARSSPKFVMDHVVYGIDSLIRITERSAVKLRPHLLTLALEVLAETISQQQHCSHSYIITSRDVIQLLKILSETAAYPDHSAAKWAMRLSALLLRKDVFSSPIPVSHIRKLMDTCQHVIKGFYPLDASASSQSDDPERCKMTLAVLEAALGVFKAASRLYSDCTQDHLTWPETFGDSQESSSPILPLTVVMETVAKAMDETFVPIVLVNNDCLSWEEIFAVFFSILGDLLVLDLNNVNLQFATKLTRSGIISLLFDACVTSGQRLNLGPSQDGLKVEIRNGFMVRLLVVLNTVDSDEEGLDSSHIAETFSVGMGQICGSRSELCRYFEHRWLTPNIIQDGDVPFATQTTICAICYFSQINGVVFVPFSELLPAICRCLAMKLFNIHRHSICYIMKYLILLFAHASIDSNEDVHECISSTAYQEALSNLVDIIRNERIASKVLTFDKQIFYWAFQSEKTAIAFGHQMIVEMLMRNHKQDENTPFEYHNIIQQEIFINQMLGIAFYEEDIESNPIGHYASRALSEFFRCQPQSLKYPSLYGHFTSILGNISGEKANRFLMIICQWLEGVGVIENTDDLNRLKILRQVCNLLSKSEENSLQCVRCCNAALLHANTTLGDNRVLNILISNNTVMATVQKLCSDMKVTDEDLSVASWNLLANLVHSQTQTRPRRSTADNVIKLMLSDLMAAILSNHPNVPIYALNVVKVMFNCNFQMGFLKVLEGQITLPTVSATRIIFITLLDAMTKSCGSDEITAITTDALLNLLRFAKLQHLNLDNYLLNQIWLSQAINIQLKRSPNAHVFRLINELLDLPEFWETSAQEVLRHLADFLVHCNTWPHIAQSQRVIDVIESIQFKISRHPFCNMLTLQQKENITAAINNYLKR